jgi:hypothetical protein
VTAQNQSLVANLQVAQYRVARSSVAAKLGAVAFFVRSGGTKTCADRILASPFTPTALEKYLRPR